MWLIFSSSCGGHTSPRSESKGKTETEVHSSAGTTAHEKKQTKRKGNVRQKRFQHSGRGNPGKESNEHRHIPTETARGSQSGTTTTGPQPTIPRNWQSSTRASATHPLSERLLLAPISRHGACCPCRALAGQRQRRTGDEGHGEEGGEKRRAMTGIQWGWERTEGSRLDGECVRWCPRKRLDDEGKWMAAHRDHSLPGVVQTGPGQWRRAGVFRTQSQDPTCSRAIRQRSPRPIPFLESKKMCLITTAGSLRVMGAVSLDLCVLKTVSPLTFGGVVSGSAMMAHGEQRWVRKPWQFPTLVQTDEVQYLT